MAVDEKILLKQQIQDLKNLYENQKYISDELDRLLNTARTSIHDLSWKNKTLQESLTLKNQRSS